MTEIRPEILEEVEACLAKIKAFLEAKGRRIHRSIRRSRKGRKGLPELEQFGLPVPEDFRALYHNHDGIPLLMFPQWQQGVFLDFHWYPMEMLVKVNKIRRLETCNPLVGRLDAFFGARAFCLELDPGAALDGQIPLLMTKGTLSRRNYLAYDSTLAMLRSVCAAQDAGIVRFRDAADPVRREGEVFFDPREFWDVIRPFNKRAEYWPALIEGSVDFDKIHVELPKNGLIETSPEMRKLLAIDKEKIDREVDRAMRRAGIAEEEIARDRKARPG